jgi:uncharacterized protein (TIGR00375 family)
MVPEGLWRWAQLKGIRVVGTGDFTHPQCFQALTDSLEPSPEISPEISGGGLYRLKGAAGDLPASCKADVGFVLQAEVSSIYKKNGSTRKVHSIILAPGLDEARRLNARLGAIGNIRSDGRPILGLGAKELLAICLEISPDMEVIPAHAWTPHFSVFGAMSGFDSLEECYDELTPHIHAIETGLSSDPLMNRRLSALDNIRLVSNSDAHSPAKLGREATLFDCEPSYAGIIRSLRTGEGYAGTIEFFPEEGKYHMDGHRKCNVSLHPKETRRMDGRCPVCGGKLTVGVMHRVEELADREEPAPERFRSIVPLAEIISQALGRGVNTKSVKELYMKVLSELGNEFHVLLDAPIDDIRHTGGERLALGIERMRRGEVSATAGYDGEFGVIRVLP